MNLLLLTFGERLENHYQAAFSILTYLKDPEITRVIVITDRPEFYHFFQENIEVISINAETLQEWQGVHQFFWRVKIKSLELAFNRYPNEHLLYVDSDTFLVSHLNEMVKGLNEGCSFMHIKENNLAYKGSKTLRKMHSALVGKSFANVPITDQSAMWNAGVIALPAIKAQQIINLSLQLCDEMCNTSCPRRLIEQFSFSIALNHLSYLNPCDHIIGHYWGNKSEWNQEITRFFMNATLKNWSLQTCVDVMKAFDWNKLPLIKKERNLHKKLINLVNKLLPLKDIHYFNS